MWLSAFFQTKRLKKGLFQYKKGAVLTTEKKVCVKVYFNPKTFSEIADQAEKSGKRKRGLSLYVQKKHGFEGEVIANTKGISKHLKLCARSWTQGEADRLAKIAQLKAKERELEAEKKQLGVEV